MTSLNRCPGGSAVRSRAPADLGILYTFVTCWGTVRLRYGTISPVFSRYGTPCVKCRVAMRQVSCRDALCQVSCRDAVRVPFSWVYIHNHSACHTTDDASTFRMTVDILDTLGRNEASSAPCASSSSPIQRRDNRNPERRDDRNRVQLDHCKNAGRARPPIARTPRRI